MVYSVSTRLADTKHMSFNFQACFENGLQSCLRAADTPWVHFLFFASPPGPCFPVSVWRRKTENHRTGFSLRNGNCEGNLNGRLSWSYPFGLERGHHRCPRHAALLLTFRGVRLPKSQGSCVSQLWGSCCLSLELFLRAPPAEGWSLSQLRPTLDLTKDR